MESEKNQSSINEDVHSNSEIEMDFLPRKKICTEDRITIEMKSPSDKELCLEILNKTKGLDEAVSSQNWEALTISLQSKIEYLNSELNLKNQEISSLKKEFKPVQEHQMSAYHADQKILDLNEDLKEKNRLLRDQIYSLSSKLKFAQDSNKQESETKKALATLKEKNMLLQTQCKFLQARLSEIKNEEINFSTPRTNHQVSYRPNKDDINDEKTFEQAKSVNNSDPKKNAERQYKILMYQFDLFHDFAQSILLDSSNTENPRGVLKKKASEIHDMGNKLLNNIHDMIDGLLSKQHELQSRISASTSLVPAYPTLEDIDVFKKEIEVWKQKAEHLHLQNESFESNSDGEFKILEFKNNPAACEFNVRVESLTFLREENDRLLGLLSKKEGLEDLVPKASLVAAQKEANQFKLKLEDTQQVIERLKTVYRYRMIRFRNAVSYLLGYELDFIDEQRTRLKSVVSDKDECTFVFVYQPDDKISMRLESSTDFTNPTIRALMHMWIDLYKSVPGFLNALAVNLLDEKYHLSSK